MEWGVKGGVKMGVMSFGQGVKMDVCLSRDVGCAGVPSHHHAILVLLALGSPVGSKLTKI